MTDNAIDITDNERAELNAFSLQSFKDYKNDNCDDAWFGIVLQCSGRTFDINIYGGCDYDLEGKAVAIAYLVDDKGSTITDKYHWLWCKKNKLII